MDELFARILHREDFVGCALESIADVAHNAIEEDQVQVIFEVSIRKFVGFLLALDLEHVFDVVKISQGAELQEASARLDFLRVVLKHVEDSWSKTVDGFGFCFELVDDIL